MSEAYQHCKCCDTLLTYFPGTEETDPDFPHFCGYCERRGATLDEQLKLATPGACLHNLSERFARGDRRFHYSREGQPLKELDE